MTPERVGRVSSPLEWALSQGAPAVGRIVFPPSAFESAEVERAFLDEHARLTAPQRRAGALLALLTWVAFAAMDFVNAGPGSGAEAIYPQVMMLRVIGAMIMATGVLVTFKTEFVDNDYAERMLLTFIVCCYLSLFAMIMMLNFPFSYILDYPGLILFLFFIIGPLRVRAATMWRTVRLCLPLTLVGLYVSTIQSLMMESHEDALTRSTIWRSMTSHYYWTAVVYISASMFVGCAIAAQLERDSRAAFGRQRQLARSNAELVSARAEAEEKTLALLAAKEELRLAAERRNLDKSMFLAQATHDLSQPTHAVGLFIESARSALARHDIMTARDLIDESLRAVRSARSSFHALMEISRLESGLARPRLAVVNVRELLTLVVEPLRSIAASEGVALRIRAARGDPVMALSDPDMFARVIGNLVSNAIKYSDRAKGASQAILVGVVPLSNRVRIDILDNGVGIAPMHWETVFKPFVQLDNPGDRRERGMGLGLSIVAAIMSLLPEHRLDMRSKEGRGTRFSLSVPRRLGLSDLEGARADGHPGGRRLEELAQLFVWYVEDDDVARLAMTALLGELGIAYEQAASFEDLERELPFTERKPDVIITDYWLSARHCARDVVRLFVDRWGSDLCALVLTGDAGLEVQEGFGIHAKIVRKPASPDHIIDAIQSLLYGDPEVLAAAQ